MADPDVIRQSLERAVETVTLRPTRGQRTYTNVATISEGTRCRVVEGESDLLLDIPRSVGGGDEGPTPSAILRSAISSCVAIGIKQWAARYDVPVDQVVVRLETDSDARGQLGVCDDIAAGFLKTRIMIRVSSPADPATVDNVVRKSLKYSPLMDVLERSQVVETRLELAQPCMT
jgi:uncharacterized OsmC-like protein